MKRFLLALAVLLSTAASAVADVDVVIRLGHQRRWIADAVTPVVIRLGNTGSEPVEIELRVSQMGFLTKGTSQYVRRVFLGASSVREETFLIVGPEQWGSGVTVLVETSPRVPVHHDEDTSDRGRLSIDIHGENAGGSPGALYHSRVFGVMFGRGRLVSGLHRALDDPAYRFGMDETVLKVEALHVDEAALGLAPASLDGMDTLVVCDPDATFCDEPRALDGLLDWVALGGHLVVSLGNRSAVFGSSPLADQLPARFGGSERRDYAGVHQTLYRMSREVRMLGRLKKALGPWTPLTALSDADTYGVNEPLRVTRRYGLGHLSVIPFDVRSAINMAMDPHERARFLKLLEFPAMPDPPEDGDAGVSDGQWVHGTLASVLQRGAFEPPPLPCILLGLVAYVVLVGPVDWFLLKRLEKERLTTLTFGATVICFTVIAYGSTLFLFAGGAQVNRVTFVDYVDAERDGRELIRVHDLAGYYSATGTDRDLSYTLPGVICGSGLPDARGSAQVGQALPVFVGGSDPLVPNARAAIAIRSQRVVRAVLTGPAGRGLEVAWSGDQPSLVNGLETDLASAWLVGRGVVWGFGTVAAGAEAAGRRLGSAALPGNEGVFNAELPRHHAESDAFAALLSLSQASAVYRQRGLDRTLAPRQLAHLCVLRKVGIDRSDSIGDERALLLATATEVPVPVPGDDSDGNTYVVIRKEVRRP